MFGPIPGVGIVPPPDRVPDRDHLRCQGKRYLTKALGAHLVAQEAKRLAHLHGIARRRRKGFVHVRQQCCRAHSGAVRDLDQRRCEFTGLAFIIHERAVAALHIEHEAVETGSQLLGQDRRGDERHGFHRAGHVSDAVETLVGGSDLTRLADDRAPNLAHGASECFRIRLGGVARNRLHLVQRAARVAETASRNHRHGDAARRYDGREHQRHDIADAAGRMLVDNGSIEIPRHRVPGVAHRERQRDRFLARHSVEANRHSECGYVRVRPRAVRKTAHEVGDLIFA